MRSSSMSRSGMMMIIGIVCVLGGAAAASAESDASASVDVPFLSAYVWRGQVLTDDAVFQPSLTASTAGFSVNAWSSMNLNDTDTDGDFTEMDWTVSYDASAGSVDWGVGVVQYTFPNSTLELEDGTVEALPGTIELYVTLGLPDVPLAPTLTVYRDVDQIDGFYGMLAIGHSFTVSDRVGVDLSASLALADSDYNSGYFGYDKTALNDALFGLAVPVAVSEQLSITPSISYMFLPDSDLGDEAEASYGEKDSFYGGVTLSYAF